VIAAAPAFRRKIWPLNRLAVNLAASVLTSESGRCYANAGRLMAPALPAEMRPEKSAQAALLRHPYEIAEAKSAVRRRTRVTR
jgi:hypothetical protein